MTGKIFIRLWAIVSLCMAGFILYSFTTKDMNQIQGEQSTAVPTPPFPAAQPISDSLAYAFFKNYHRSIDPAGSQGTLRNKGQAIVQFYVDEASLIIPLRAKAKALGKEFIGLSAIPAYDDKDSSNTLIWVAVVDADPGSGVTPELMLPQKGDKWTDYVYDQIASCPDLCPQRSTQLWNNNWKP